MNSQLSSVFINISTMTNVCFLNRSHLVGHWSHTTSHESLSSGTQECASHAHSILSLGPVGLGTEGMNG